MLRVSRWVLIASVALLISLLPFGVSWAHPGHGQGREESSAHGRQEEAGQEQTDEPPSEDSEDEAHSASESESASESQGQGSSKASPSRSSDQNRRPRPGSSESGADQAGDVLDASFSASPASIAVGETSTLAIDVTNPSDSSASDLELLVDLPAHLDLVSSDRPATESGRTLQISLGDLAPGSTVTTRLVVVGVDAPGGSVPVRFALTADGATYHHELLVSIADPAFEGLGLTQSSPLLVQVGDVASFSISVSNNTTGALEDVSVVTEIAPEIDVVGVAPTEAADAVQLGASPSGEDIVWVFESLEPGEQVELLWTGRAVAPGDLEADNLVEAALQGEIAATSRQNTYLGYVKGVQIDRSDPAAPVVRERVVTKLVPVTSEVAASVGGGVLPVTGWSPVPLGIGGLLLIALGGLLMWEPKRRTSKRLTLVLAGALVLTGSACVSDDRSTDDAAPQVAASPSAGPNDELGGADDEPEDQVLGIRLHRPEAQEGDAPSSDAPESGDVEPTQMAEVVMEEVSEVVTVVVPVAELPVQTLASRPGDNSLSFSWTSGTDLQATSSRIISSDATEEILVAVSGQGDSLSATVTVTNLADDRRLQVDGRLALEVTSADGRTSSLVSGPIHATLDPGAQTVADLTFSLPSGSYSARGAFQAE